MANIELTLYETRVIGSLIEKEITTPEQYPLSLNALTNACNQKTNRDPVLEMSESTVQETLDALSKKRLVRQESGYGSRVPKYRHRFCNSEFGQLNFSAQELGIICALFLRGAQTPGELRIHSNRLCSFADVPEVEATLEKLMQREDGPFVAVLPRQPGKRESRYLHLFGNEAPAAPDSATAPDEDADDRLALLEMRVEELEAQMSEFKALLAKLSSMG